MLIHSFHNIYWEHAVRFLDFYHNGKKLEMI